MGLCCMYTHTILEVSFEKLRNFFEDCFYLLERERAQAGLGAGGEGEADPPLSREPHVGLSPRTLRS